MPTQTPPRVIHLPRSLPCRTIAGLVHLAVEICNQDRLKWTAGYVQRTQMGGTMLLLGQNSCFVPGRLQVRPKGGALFEVSRQYRTLEVAWCTAWPRITCEGHRHHKIAITDTIAQLSDAIERLVQQTVLSTT